MKLREIKKKLKVNKYFLIKWEDASSMDKGWNSLDFIKEAAEEPFMVTTVGTCTHLSDSAVVFTLSRTEEEHAGYSGIIFIPYLYIRSIQELYLSPKDEKTNG